MPGTQQGVDLRFNKDNPMNWKEYSSRLKSNGVAIHKGDTARVTAVVVKDDRIEFQLDGGGFGTFLDDSSTTVTAKTVDKSDYEKQLEREIANTTDDDQRRKLQRDLDRERARRERQEADNRNAAQVASQIKAQKVADRSPARRLPIQPALAGRHTRGPKNSGCGDEAACGLRELRRSAASGSSACDAKHGRRCDYPGNGATKAGHEDKRGHELIRAGKAVIGICFAATA